MTRQETPRALWCVSYRADPVAARLADRHYSRQSIGAAQFVPPGRVTFIDREKVRPIRVRARRPGAAAGDYRPDPDVIAKWCYEVADAMLAARDRK